VPGEIKIKVPYSKALFNPKENAYVAESSSPTKWVVKTPQLGGFAYDGYARDRLMEEVVPKTVNGQKCLVFTDKSDDPDNPGRQLAQRITEAVESVTETQGEASQEQSPTSQSPIKKPEPQKPEPEPEKPEPETKKPETKKPETKKPEKPGAKKPSKTDKEEAANQDDQEVESGGDVLFESKGVQKAAADLKLRRIAFIISGS